MQKSRHGKSLIGYRITDDYLTAKAGMNFYFGTSTSEREELAKAERGGSKIRLKQKRCV